MYKGLCIWVMRLNPCILYYVLLNNKRMDLSRVDVGRDLLNHVEICVFSLMCACLITAHVCVFIWGNLVPRVKFPISGIRAMVVRSW